MDFAKWKKVKRSGGFRRKVESKLRNIQREPITNYTTQNFALYSVLSKSFSTPDKSPCYSDSNSRSDFEICVDDERLEISDNWSVKLDDYIDSTSCIDENNSSDDCGDDIKNENVQQELRTWATTFNIRQRALRELFKILNKRLPNILPQDPRTLLQTPKIITILKVGEGQYWHQGLESCLRSFFRDIDESKSISLNINIDGLPIYKSSKEEFWPILFNIHEISLFRPRVIAIYSGKGKPNDLKEFLSPFVDELKEIMKNGIDINGKKLTVKIRCFICDSPARAFIKGVTNFNGQNGCLKCTTVGEYSYISHCNIFPRTHCPKRTDAEFRAKTCSLHHKRDTPLEQLPIDMIEDFVVGDSLHLIDLGVMKRCLIGWRDGNFGTYRTKWPAREIEKVSRFLVRCKMPVELHRAIRGLDCLSFWKGLEYRTFLYYIGIVVLKDNLPYDAYEHFLVLFCAITICSSNVYCQYLDLAKILLDHYIENYRDIYGEDYITSNVHNLCHLVDEVKKFGVLSTFSSYPFESKLYHIKNMLRHGNNPLSQVARRVYESETCEVDDSITMDIPKQFPILKNKITSNDILTQIRTDIYAKVEFDGFLLSPDIRNKWFLTQGNEIVGMKHGILRNNVVSIYGSSLRHLSNFFETPIRSSYLNIYVSDCEENLPKEYTVNSIKCKLVAVKYNDEETVFIPLLHTL